MTLEDIPEQLVEELIHNLRTIPNSDEQELGYRIDARRTTFEWWVRDFLKRHDIVLVSSEEGAL